MRHKWKIGTFFGIGVHLHWTLLLLVAWIILSQASLAAGLFNLLFVAAIFACVVAHEYGHALMARHYGIGTQDITLYPIGGIAALRAMPKRPREEMAVALAGPAVNVVIAVVLALFLLVTGLWTAYFFSIGGFLVGLLIANVLLAGFNLIPAFPMDGGRVLRAWLARTRDYATATDQAAKVGRVFALIFAIVALVQGMPFLLILAAFIYLMAGAERRHAYMERDAARFRFFPFGDRGFQPYRPPERVRRDPDPEFIDVDVIYSPRSR